MKRGILLAVFGSNTVHGKTTLSFFEEQVRRRLPALPVRWAFTSRTARDQFDCEGKKITSVRNALEDMATEKFTHIVAQPLHVIPGIEYSEIVSIVQDLKKDANFPVVLIGRPLLMKNKEVVLKAVKAVFDCIPKERTPEEPVLFMGHGSRRLPEDKYMDLAESAAAQDPLVFIGTMNGAYRLEHILPKLEGTKRRVWLLPLLALVGNHVLEDMAGDGEGSWKSRLEAQGFTCVSILKGMIEQPAFIEIWIDHLEQALKTLYAAARA